MKLGRQACGLDFRSVGSGLLLPAFMLPLDPWLTVCSFFSTTYHVKSGDTGQSIAKQDNTTFQKLEKLNPDVNWNNLQIGSTLIVPRD